MSNNYHIYLGDSVYASFDGYQIWLHLNSATSEPLIALEPQVLAMLDMYREQLNVIIERERAEAMEEEDDRTLPP